MPLEAPVIAYEGMLKLSDGLLGAVDLSGCLSDMRSFRPINKSSE